MGEVLAILARHRDQAVADRAYHKAFGPRLGNVDACIAACKVAWLDAILREIRPLTKKLPSPSGEP